MSGTETLDITINELGTINNLNNAAATGNIVSFTDTDSALINSILAELLDNDSLTVPQTIALQDRIKVIISAKAEMMSSIVDKNTLLQSILDYDISTLHEQANAVEIIESQLVIIQANLEALELKKRSRERNTKLNIYYSKSYLDHVKLIKLAIIVVGTISLIKFVTQYIIIPGPVINLLYGLTVSIGIIMVFYKIKDIKRRDNVDYDKYYFNPPTEDDIMEIPTAIANGVAVDGKHISVGELLAGNLWGCFGASCCDESTTKWDEDTNTCQQI
jgi:hypothetical protein